MYHWLIFGLYMKIFPYFQDNVDKKRRLLHGYLALILVTISYFILSVFNKIKKNNGTGKKY